MANRWWTYQKERFPVFVFGVFVAAVCLGVIVASSVARGAGAPSWKSFVVAFVCTFLVFLQLRIADEHKDFEDDAAARPYRPVQRGLVSLKELRVVGALTVVAQVAVVLWLDARLLWPLGVVLVYLALMGKEFFVPVWLKARPVAYLLSHQIILPLIYLFIGMCDWWVDNGVPPTGLAWILCMSYCSGMVVEIGRKIRVPGDEEEGVETYSGLWGRRGAVAVWLTVMLLSGVFAALTAKGIGIGALMVGVATILFVAAVVVASRFLRTESAGAGGRIEATAGVWTVIVHAAFALALIG
jgi:hypothetical protein